MMAAPYFTPYLRHILLSVSALILFSMLGACSIFPQSPTLQSYLLPSYSLESGIEKKMRPANWSLRIIQPNTTQFLSGTRIAVQPQDNEIAVYKGIRWSDLTPILFRNRLIQEFRTDTRVGTVTSDDSRLRVDYELSGDLTAFQGVYQIAGSEVLIRFDAHLKRTLDQRIIASRSFEVHQPIAGKSIDEVVKAFGLANDQLAAQLLNWTLKQTGHSD